MESSYRWAILLFLGACQTIPAPKPLLLPVTVQENFDACMADDGEARVTLEGPGAETVDFHAEWISKSDRSWIVEAANPLGQTVLRLSYASTPVNIGASGPFAANLPPLEIDKNGFLNIEGHFIGIKAQEIPCFLKRKLPLAWLDHAYEYVQEKDKGTIYVEDKWRMIQVRADNISEIKKRHTCALVQWRHTLNIFKEEMQLCIRYEKPESMTLTGLGEYKISWGQKED